MLGSQADPGVGPVQHVLGTLAACLQTRVLNKHAVPNSDARADLPHARVAAPEARTGAGANGVVHQPGDRGRAAPPRGPRPPPLKMTAAGGRSGQSPASP